MKDFDITSPLQFEGDKPKVIAFIGPNGSGKSSIIQQLKLTNAHVGDTRYQGRVVTIPSTNETILPIVNA